SGQPVVPPIESGAAGLMLVPDVTSRGFRYRQPGDTNGIGHWDFEGSGALPYRFLPNVVGRFMDIAPDWKTSAWIGRTGELRFIAHDSRAAEGRSLAVIDGYSEARFTRDGKGLIALGNDRRSFAFCRLPDLSFVSSGSLTVEGRIGQWGFND